MAPLPSGAPKGISAGLLVSLKDSIKNNGGRPFGLSLPDGITAVRESSWRQAYYQANGGAGDTNRKRFSRRWSLLESGHVAHDSGWYWIPPAVVQSAPQQDRPRFVYVVTALGSSGLCKIGIASSPEKRLKQLSTSSPHALRLDFTRFVNDAPAIERSAHDYFADHRRNGEWFALPARDAISFVNQLADAER